MLSVQLASVSCNVAAHIADHVQPFDLTPSGYSAIDHAWKCGWDCMVENFWDECEVHPPAEFSVAEAEAFRLGASEALKSCEHELEMSRTPFDDDDCDAAFDEWARSQEHRGGWGHSADESESW